jgi:hypothetical protein
MGLDCTAFSKVEFVEMATFDEDGDIMVRWDEFDADGNRWWDTYVVARHHPEFPGRADPIIDKGVYAYEDSVGWKAGSYGSYSRFRSELAGLVGYTPEDIWNGRVGMDRPFSLLVNFSDCEGIIGTTAAIKLLAEFREHEAHARPRLQPYDMQSYEEWIAAFALAADNGFVDFH